MKTLTVLLSGRIHFGKPMLPSDEFVEIPATAMESHELVYRILDDFQHFRAGDLLILERRRKAASGECALVKHNENLYIGTWWTKHKKKQLIVDPSLKPMSDVTLIGVINFIVRSQ